MLYSFRISQSSADRDGPPPPPPPFSRPCTRLLFPLGSFTLKVILIYLIKPVDCLFTPGLEAILLFPRNRINFTISLLNSSVILSPMHFSRHRSLPSVAGRCSLAYHRLSSPEPAPSVAESMKSLPSSQFLSAGRSYRLPSNSSLSNTALNRLAKLLNQRGTANLEAPVEDAGVRRLSWEK